MIPAHIWDNQRWLVKKHGKGGKCLQKYTIAISLLMQKSCVGVLMMKFNSLLGFPWEWREEWMKARGRKADFIVFLLGFVRVLIWGYFAVTPH